MQAQVPAHHTGQPLGLKHRQSPASVSRSLNSLHVNEAVPKGIIAKEKEKKEALLSSYFLSDFPRVF